MVTSQSADPGTATAVRLDMAEGRGRRVLWAILVFVLVIPAINIKQMMDGQVPSFLMTGGVNVAFATGMFSSVLLVVLWYFVYQGKRFARVILGACYLAAASVVVALMLGVSVANAILPGPAIFGIILGGLYGVVGWVLLVSTNIKAFQTRQQALRRRRLGKLDSSVG